MNGILTKREKIIYGIVLALPTALLIPLVLLELLDLIEDRNYTRILASLMFMSGVFVCVNYMKNYANLKHFLNIAVIYIYAILISIFVLIINVLTNAKACSLSKVFKDIGVDERMCLLNEYLGLIVYYNYISSFAIIIISLKVIISPQTKYTDKINTHMYRLFIGFLIIALLPVLLLPIIKTEFLQIL